MRLHFYESHPIRVICDESVYLSARRSTTLTPGDRWCLGCSYGRLQYRFGWR